jgi:hypothetical protein
MATISLARGSVRVAFLCALWSCSGLPAVPLLPPTLPEQESIRRVELPYQGWTDAERHWFHHVTQGTTTPQVPYSWFKALEQPRLSLFEAPLLSDPEYLTRFGFVPSFRSELNPDGLPVGFALLRGAVEPTTGKSFEGWGFTCAACHTGQIEYRGTAIRVEGGPAMTDLGKFRDAVSLALGYTRFDPFRFRRFAKRVLGPDHSDEQARELKNSVIAAVSGGLGNPELRRSIVHASTEEGFGRLDAIGRIGNFVFAVEIDPKNIRPLRAPVAYPHLWDASWFNWVQYNGSIRQPMVRNAGEALGVYALADLKGPAETRFNNNADIEHLYRIEQLLAGRKPFEGLRPPPWPEHVLG